MTTPAAQDALLLIAAIGWPLIAVGGVFFYRAWKRMQ